MIMIVAKDIGGVHADFLAPMWLKWRVVLQYGNQLHNTEDATFHRWPNA